MTRPDFRVTVSAFLIIALFIIGCKEEVTSPDESVVQGEARSVFVRNHSDFPMRFAVEINGAPYDSFELNDGSTIIFYEPLPVGLARDQVEGYQIEGKLIDNFGRTTEGKHLEFSLDLGKSEVYPYHPNGWWNSTLHPSYRFNEPLDEWLEEINAEAHRIENFRTIHVAVSPIEKGEK